MPKSEHGAHRPTLGACLRLMRLHRPIGILLLLWPVLWALWIAADGLPSLSVLVVFVLGTVLMRSAGCVINDYADRDFDGHVRRTRERPLATGELSPRFALQLFAAPQLQGPHHPKAAAPADGVAPPPPCLRCALGP